MGGTLDTWKVFLDPLPPGHYSYLSFGSQLSCLFLQQAFPAPRLHQVPYWASTGRSFPTLNSDHQA